MTQARSRGRDDEPGDEVPSVPQRPVPRVPDHEVPELPEDEAPDLTRDEVPETPGTPSIAGERPVEAEEGPPAP
jgi:hypothetical protein